MTSTMIVDNVIPRADIVRHADRLGAEVKNIRLSDELSDEVIRAISRLLLAHKVIFFRGQRHLDDAEQQRFAVRLGSLMSRSPVEATEGKDSISEVAPSCGRDPTDQMHTNIGFGEAGPKISVLRSVVVPPNGRDMAWSNAAAAYLDLPESLRMLANDLWAVHCSAYNNATRSAAETGNTHFDDVFTGTIYETARPIVGAHPATGERMLVLGRSVQHFAGLQKCTSDKLFVLLQSYLTAPKNTVCWSWEPGDVAIWDNRATAHHTVDQLDGEDHTLGGVAGEDSEPLRIVGRRSVEHIRKSKLQKAKAA